jgi:hypothetical protein
MTQEESLARARRELKMAKNGKEVAEAMMGHFKTVIKERASTDRAEALIEYSIPLYESRIGV